MTANKDLNRLKVVLAEKGGGRETIECLVEGTRSPIFGYPKSWVAHQRQSPSGVQIHLSLL